MKDRRLMTADEAASYLGISKSTLMRLGHKCGWRVQFGKRVLYDTEKMDETIKKGGAAL